jgi:hypothetical protein
VSWLTSGTKIYFFCCANARIFQRFHGLFQHEPLGMAKNLVDKIDKHLQTDSRFFLYMAPGRKTSDGNVNFLA